MPYALLKKGEEYIKKKAFVYCRKAKVLAGLYSEILYAGRGLHN